jgi:hypothetical protein
MTKAAELKAHLKPGQVYRRNDLEKWSNSVDRHLQELQKEGTLKKVAAGMYYYPKKGTFGEVPPTDNDLVMSFLKDDRFLITSPNDYNKLGVGTTQLYNKTVVYNHKRHGEVKLGNRVFSFQQKPYFPTHVTREFLLVDLVNNLDLLAEDETAVLSRVKKKVQDTDYPTLNEAVKKYGSVKTQKLFASLLDKR